MDRSTFLQSKVPSVMIAGTPVSVTAKEFSTGSVGFNITGKVPVVIGEEVVMLQVSGNLTAIHSKNWTAQVEHVEDEKQIEKKKRKREEVAA